MSTERESAPHSLDEKVQAHRSTGGRPRASLEALNRRWHVDSEGNPSPWPTLDAKRPADSVVVFSLSGHEHWVRVGPPQSEKTAYELFEVRHGSRDAALE